MTAAGTQSFLCFDPADTATVEYFVGRFGPTQPAGLTTGVSDRDRFVRYADERLILTEIQRQYLANTTVTLVLVGARTWTRRYIDWEIAASTFKGNAVLAVPLDETAGPPPARVQLLAEQRLAIARTTPPNSDEQLNQWMDEALQLGLDRSLRGRAAKTPLMRQDARAHWGSSPAI